MIATLEASLGPGWMYVCADCFRFSQLWHSSEAIGWLLDDVGRAYYEFFCQSVLADSMWENSYLSAECFHVVSPEVFLAYMLLQVRSYMAVLLGICQVIRE